MYLIRNRLDGNAWERVGVKVDEGYLEEDA
jgi:hypothetical protein